MDATVASRHSHQSYGTQKKNNLDEIAIEYEKKKKESMMSLRIYFFCFDNESTMHASIACRQSEAKSENLISQLIKNILVADQLQLARLWEFHMKITYLHPRGKKKKHNNAK